MAGKREYRYDYPRPMVTVDAAMLRVHEGDLQVLLIKRKAAPWKGRWALPGGFIQMKESLEESVIREVAEETGITIPPPCGAREPFLIQLGAYGDPKRDPRGRVITVTFVGIFPPGGRDCEARAGDDAADARWMPLEDVPEKLAGDHGVILSDALERLAAEGQKLKKSKGRKVKESKSQRVEESKSQRVKKSKVKRSKGRKVKESKSRGAASL